MTGAERARRWRAAMRAKGLRPRTFWLPDASTPEFKEQARRDCEGLRRWYSENPTELQDILSLQADTPDDSD
jgi:ABC-type branched-subunit amino acid transport system substrate-binding protein